MPFLTPPSGSSLTLGATSHETKMSLARLELANTAFFDAMERTRAKRNQRNIMSSLRFESMDDRYSMVSEAADSTFDWIFNNPKKEMESNLALVRPLKDWLDQGTGIFHISAKPGAGKSTLMKYLWSNPQTQEKLRSWAGSPSIDHGELLLLETWQTSAKAPRRHDAVASSPSADATPRCHCRAIFEVLGSHLLRPLE